VIGEKYVHEKQRADVEHYSGGKDYAARGFRKQGQRK
jgi:hypothetical protein